MVSMNKNRRKNNPKLSVASKNEFQKTVEKVVDIKTAYKSGLQALGTNASLISIKNTRNLEGSVDIDSTTATLYPNDNRWDYVFSYERKAYYVEVHPAYTGEVKKVVAKRTWLLNWLVTKAAELNSYQSASPRFYWIQSGKCAILPNSPEYKQAAAAGLVPRSGLSI